MPIGIHGNGQKRQALLTEDGDDLKLLTPFGWDLKY